MFILIISSIWKHSVLLSGVENRLAYWHLETTGVKFKKFAKPALRQSGLRMCIMLRDS